MARTTGGALTGAGFTQAGTKYTKTQGTAVAVVDLATGLDKTGVGFITQAAPGVPIAAADWAAHAATLGLLGVSTLSGNVDHAPGLVYYGQSV